MFLSWDDGGITYWGAPTVLTSAQEQRETWERRGLFHRACTLQNRTEETLKNKLQRDRKSIPPQRPFTLLTNTKPWCHSLLLCPVRESQRSHTTHMRQPENYNTYTGAHFWENNSPHCDYCIWWRVHLRHFAEYSLFFALPVPFFPLFITMSVHTHTQTQLAEGGKVVKRVCERGRQYHDLRWWNKTVWLLPSLLLLAVVEKPQRISGRRQTQTWEMCQLRYTSTQRRPNTTNYQHKFVSCPQQQEQKWRADSRLGSQKEGWTWGGDGWAKLGDVYSTTWRALWEHGTKTCGSVLLCSQFTQPLASVFSSPQSWLMWASQDI